MANTIRVALDEDGLAGQWLEIVDVGTFSPRQIKQLRANATTPEDLAALSEEKAAAAARELIGLTVKGWSVFVAGSTDLLPAPTSPDLDPEDIPIVVQGRIGAEIRGRLEQIADLKARSLKG